MVKHPDSSPNATWRVTRNLILAATASLATGPTAHAWDGHHLLTRHTIRGLAPRDSALYNQLLSPVPITSMETFMSEAFGSSCTWDKMKNQVLNGVGENYRVRYAEKFGYQLNLDWARGVSHAAMWFSPAAGPGNPVGPGFAERPIDILSVYSDEPDWELDDDVPRLKGKGVSPDAEGMSTRVLRHFWYEGETSWGIDFSQDQELDQRAQLFTDLALVAFSVHQPYWGYRFLGIALHYFQDISQPFHAKAVINDKMVYSTEVLRGGLCEWRAKRHPEELARCEKNGVSTMNAVTRSGWLTGAFHGIYEDFARGLISVDVNGTPTIIADQDRSAEKSLRPKTALPLTRDSRNLIEVLPFVRQIQKTVLPYSEDVGAKVYSMLGNRYRLELETFTKAEIERNGRPDSVGYRIGVASFDDFRIPGAPDLNDKQIQTRGELIKMTNELLALSGAWGRTYLKATLTDVAGIGKNKELTKAIARVRETMKLRCR